MTEHRTMNAVIHAAFRRDLDRFESALAAFPAGSQARADRLKVAWDNYATQLHHHHDDEETLFWPALQEAGVDLSEFGELEAEHALMQQALADADRTMTELAAAPTAAHAASSHAAVLHLREVLLDHLDHEERDLEPLAHQHHGSGPMAAARKAVRKAHPGNTGTFLAWLLDGADDDARAGLRKEVPAPVVFLVSRIGGRHYRRAVAPTWA
jgi:hypothetical protein